jgi:phosphate starvation-inducible PhoH-like protein
LNALQISREIVLEPADNDRLANLCGQFDEHLRQIERRLGVEIASRGNRFRVTGRPGAAEAGGDILETLFRLAAHERLDPERVHIHLQDSVMNQGRPAVDPAFEHEVEDPVR